jgi:hypothetical protein
MGSALLLLLSGEDDQEPTGQADVLAGEGDVLAGEDDYLAGGD